MQRAIVAGFLIVVSLASASFSKDTASSQPRLDRLKSFGYIVNDYGMEDHKPRIVVPHHSTVTFAAINELRQYCIEAAPQAEVVFLGPVVVEEQVRQFRRDLPNAHIRRMSAVWLGVTFNVCLDDDRINDVCRIEGFERGSPAAELGLKQGDIILGLGEYRWPESHSLDSFSFASKCQIPGEKSTIIVKRDNEILSFPVTWRTLPTNPWIRPL